MLLLLPAYLQAAEAPQDWLDWLDGLKKEMIAKGVSAKTIAKAYDGKTYYHKIPEVVQKDQKQAEFILTSTHYMNRLINKERVEQARRHYKDLQKKYPDIEKKYGVPLSYLTAFWAVETNFGQNKGKYHLIDSLTNLSYRNRRSEFFKNELYNVLKIMDKYDLDDEKIMGSWAGAMGHFQFMPSTYNAYAIDYDKDGVADIWDSFPDALGSAANYLNSLGWKTKESWGQAVLLPWNFDYTQVGRKNSKTVEQWHKLGVRDINGKKLACVPDAKGSIITPEGRKGNAYLIFGNFKRIMIWNRSENYALAISLLADYIESGKPYQRLKEPAMYSLTDQDIQKVQTFANKILRAKLKEDGKLGPKTQDAVKKLQAKAKMHQDGYPDYQLLNKIKKYNPRIGFNVPVQPRKNNKKQH